MSRPTARRARRCAAAVLIAASTAALVAVPAEATPIRAHQMYGADRYLTSLVLEDPPMDTAFIVTGQDFPDGLAASAVAGRIGANVYLSPRGQLTADVRQRLGYHKTIVVVGSEGALSADVMTWLQQNTRAKLLRLDGRDRYETAAAVARYGYPSGASRVLIATGTNYPDALAGSAAGAKTGAPVLLVTHDGIPEATAQVLRELEPSDVTIVGSEGVVPAAVADRLAALTSANVERVAGRDRYETAVALAQRFFTAADTESAVLVSGSSWADAVPAGAYVGRRRGPLFLTPSTCVPQSVNLGVERLDVTYLTAVGGPGVLADEARKRTSCGAGAKTYLDTLTWPAGNARVLSDHATIGGVFYPRSMSYDTDPRNSEYRTWDLDGRFSRFTATVGLADGNASGLSSRVDVYGDEKLLVSRTVAAGAPAVLDVPVAGVDNLKVVTTSTPRSASVPSDNVVYLGDAAVS